MIAANHDAPDDADPTNQQLATTKRSHSPKLEVLDCK